MIPVVLVHGTWSRHADWFLPNANLPVGLATRGFKVIPFLWSGYCGGVPDPIIVPPSTDDLKGGLELWRSEGEKLAYFCRVLGLERPHVISHSHGLQVTAFAAASGQAFATALSIAGPIREDMRLVRERARKQIARWVQCVDPHTDWMIHEGECADGNFGWTYDLPEADETIHTEGHSGACRDMVMWDTKRLWDRFT